MRARRRRWPERIPTGHRATPLGKAHAPVRSGAHRLVDEQRNLGDSWRELERARLEEIAAGPIPARALCRSSVWSGANLISALWLTTPAPHAAPDPPRSRSTFPAGAQAPQPRRLDQRRTATERGPRSSSRSRVFGRQMKSTGTSPPPRAAFSPEQLADAACRNSRPHTHGSDRT
jgi:hypothetical protein